MGASLTDMAAKALSLRWLEPSSASLAALGLAASSPERDAELWPKARLDPAFTLLTLRHHLPMMTPSITNDRWGFPRFRHIELLSFALDQIGQTSHVTGWIDWSRPRLRPLLDLSKRIADFSHRIALRCSACDPEFAWAVGLITPLGSMALAAVDPVGIERLWDVSDRESDPIQKQKARWGIDAAALARRLAHQWGLPDSLAVVVGSLRLPISTAMSLGADPALFAVIRLACELSILVGGRDGLGLVHGTDPLEAARFLGLKREQLRSLSQDRFRHESDQAEPIRCRRPTEDSHLPDLLRLALEVRRRDDRLATDVSESRLDTLHDALTNRHRIEEAELQERKLAALAEFAAGASHEINNPLAVISGHTQSLLPSESEPRREASLRAIIRQTNRIHNILTELMQFARPSEPNLTPVDLKQLIREMIDTYEEHAESKRVRVDLIGPSSQNDEPIIMADARQLRMALGCLLRNGIEAASAEDGWVRITLARSENNQWKVSFEDNGTGPPAGKIRHLFDPFFSGRDAGRGRGLGLPTAWRLARLHGGDVQYEPHPDGVTCFVLTLPSDDQAERSRRCA